MATRKKKAKPVANPPRVMAVRANAGKPQLGRIMDFPNAMGKFAAVCEAGDMKYTKLTGTNARYNWRKGFPASELLDSAMRHLMAFHNGEDFDEETQCLHVAQAMWNCAALIETLARHDKVFDDRDLGDDS